MMACTPDSDGVFPHTMCFSMTMVILHGVMIIVSQMNMILVQNIK